MKKIILMATVGFFLAALIPAYGMSAPRWVGLSAGTAGRRTKLEEISRTLPVKSTAAAVTLEITLPGFFLAEQEMEDGRTYALINAPGAGSHEVGRPDLPVFGTTILIPNGTTPVIEVVPGKPRVFEGIEVAPLQPPAPDGERPPFTKDADMYERDQYFPADFAVLEPIARIRGQESSILWLYPYRYNPARKRLQVYPDLRVTVRFEGSSRHVPARLQSRSFNRLLGRLAVNAEAVLTGEETEDAEAGAGVGEPRGSGASGACDYLIITHPNFSEAAETMAAWERKAGFLTYVATTSETGSTSAEILAYLQDAYDTWDPAPTYVLFIGDAEFVPTNYETVHPYSGDLIGTDLYYATLDGSDYFPDIITGRLSVDTAEEAAKRVNDIIAYETDPVTDSSFYATAAICAYFQHAGAGYAERRFAQTSEDLAIYLSDPSYLGDYSVERFYYTGSTVTPLYWSTTWFSGGPAGDAGDPIPSYLEKPGFAWDATAADISAAVNDGRFLVTHRDHGSATGWGSPSYSASNVSALTNGDKLPVVWSVNCLTGFFDKETCQSPSSTISFSEAWERNPSGGAAGVIAATRVSYSGHNDRLFWGWIDAIWPDFVGSYGVANPAYRMGDVLNYGKAYYATTYSATTTRKVEFEIFHWFGDPAMMIRTEMPRALSVSHAALVSLGIPLDFDVTVEYGGSPLEGATVTVSRSDVPDDYRVETTDATGSATFTDLVTSETGDYDLVVTAPNTIPYQGTFMSMVGSVGYIDLDDTIYSCSDEIDIAVYDLDLAGIGSQGVTVSSSGGDTETVILAENPAGSGIFMGALTTASSSPTPGDGELQVADGDLITALYNDEDDGTGNPAVVQETADADCTPPIFAGLAAAVGGPDAVTLAWNEASDPNGPITYVVYRDQTAGLPVGAEIGTTTLLTYTDEEIAAGEVYFYTARARDRLGNEDANIAEQSGSAYLAELPFADGFESGTLEAAWTVYTTAEGRVRVATGYPAEGSYSLLLDDSTSASEYSIAAAVLHLDLSGESDVTLSFRWREFGDENHPEDGVFISDDSGVSWHQILSFNGGTTSYAAESIDLDAEIQSAGLTYNSRFQVKFQFYDNYPIPSDGYAIDAVSLISAASPTPSPAPTAAATSTPTATSSPVPTASMTPPAIPTPPILIPAAWPTGSGTEIGSGLPSGYEPSGAVWHERLGVLFLVSDDGWVSWMDQSGTSPTTWTPGGDLEGIAVADPSSDYLYLGVEDPDSIREFDISTGALTGKSWNLTTWMTGAPGSGLEALTFVPNGDHPYPASDSGGLFYAGLQADGRIYVFDVDLAHSGTVSPVDTIEPYPGLTDLSGLHYHAETGILYAIFDSWGLLLEMDTNGAIIGAYVLPGDTQEGVTLLPACPETNTSIFIAEDAGEVWRYDGYPIVCLTTPSPSPSPTVSVTPSPSPTASPSMTPPPSPPTGTPTPTPAPSSTPVLPPTATPLPVIWEEWPGMLGWWRYEDPSGVLADESGNGFDAVASGGGVTYRQAGVYGSYCLEFDGSSWLESSCLADYNQGAGSIAAWFSYADEGAIRLMVGRQTAAGRRYLAHLDLEGDRVLTGGVGGGILPGESGMGADTWYFGVVTWDTSEGVNIYLDGRLEYSGPMSTAVVTGPYYFGANNYKDNGARNHFSGLLDEVTIWDRALTAPEVMQMYYNAAPTPSPVATPTALPTPIPVVWEEWPGMLGWWRYEEPSGVLADESGNGFDAVASGGGVTYRQAGVYGSYCLEFDGSSWLESSCLADYNQGAGSIAAWFSYADEGAIRLMVGRQTAAGRRYLAHLDLEGDRVLTGGVGGGILPGESGMGADTWYFGVVTWDTSEGVNIYLDGRLEYSGPMSTAVVTGPYYFGANNYKDNGARNHFSGLLDEVTIWDRALTAPEVMQMYYNAAPTPSPVATPTALPTPIPVVWEEWPGMLGWWRYEEPSGVLADESGNGFDAVASGGGVTYRQAGVYGSYCLEFDGSSWLESSCLADYNQGAGSIAAWFSYADEGAIRLMVGRQTAAGRRYLAHLDLEGDRVLTGGVGGGILPGESGMGADTWYFGVVTWDTSEGVNIYLDGRLEYSGPMSTAVVTGPYYFGANNYKDDGARNHFSGLLDEVTIWDRALTAPEVRRMYYNAAPTPVPAADDDQVREGTTPPPAATPTVSPADTGLFPVLDSGDYDGDGVSEFAIFRPSSGLWAVRTVTRVYFGVAGDIPASGDYDGDGTADIGLFRPASSLWVLRGISRVYYGRPGDVPVPADYDGDATTDVGLFRRESALWAVRGVTVTYFGVPGDLPAPGYYDGSGTASIGIFRPATGVWVLKNFSRFYFGREGDIPIPGEYAGDSLWTAAVFRPARPSLWRLRGVSCIYFGDDNDRPLAADFDGDLIDDPALFNGEWIIPDVTRVYYGLPGDLPVTR